MKNISAQLKKHLEGSVTSIATCWKLMPKEAPAIGFTNHDEALSIDGLRYEAIYGFEESAQEDSDSLVASRGCASVFEGSSPITATALAKGIYDMAVLEIFAVNWQDLSMGRMEISAGVLGEVKYGRGRFEAEVRSLSQFLSKNVCDTYSPSCRAELGDSKCKVDMNLHKESGKALSGGSDISFGARISKKAGWCNGGVLIWQSGRNKDTRCQVRDYNGKRILLQNPMMHEISKGDRFIVYAGCDKAWDTCRKKFKNSINFRGEPHVPSLDDV